MLVSCPRCLGTLNSDSDTCPHCGLTNYPTAPAPAPIGRRARALALIPPWRDICRVRAFGRILSKRRALALGNFRKRPQYQPR